ncbi:ABC transporter substrate-binding protein [Paenibacillus allorhizosphaerae]|uniref:Extracellular solute-binding protein n=1 Tax=Paenibacillus allorhizosphaerae TaxID=2849866 RepID=A0ABM8V9W9_9BACL|nr:extracellular solute-binding protein [Paenibacillus allorhizosphaerae]CAG7613738.1 hypothetical protein PAECIP111802_00008 [Paenibacillus allorhizosphaerae]
MWKKSSVVSFVFVSLTAVIVGCSGGDTGKQQTAPSPEPEKAMVSIDQLENKSPITLKIWTGANEILWKNTIEDPIKKKFPNITLERVPLQQNTLEKLIAAGNPPDIIHGSKNHMILQVMPTKMQFDHTELIKKYNYDLGRLAPELLQSIKAFGDKGQMYGFPNTRVLYGLLYNKQLFDRFAVPYPKDGMTWDEAIQLAKRMTRNENGVQYLGMELPFYSIIPSQLNLEVIDRNDKASLSKWSRGAAVSKQIYDIPGNQGPLFGNLAQSYDPFYKQTLAMLPSSLDTMFGAAKNYPDLQWDLVTMPTLPEAPNTDPYMNYSFFAVTPMTPHKEEAFKVIAHLLSDEVQTQMVRKGYPTVLKNTDIQKQFAAEVPELQGKNLQAPFKNKQSDPFVSKYFDSSVDLLAKNAFIKIMKGQGDINTNLREVDEAIDKKVAELKK